MNAEGWIFLVLSWGGILALFIYCLSRTIKSPDAFDKEEPKG